MEVRSSRWARFVSAMKIVKLNESARALWVEMKVDFMTHVKLPDKQLEYHVKASTNHRKTKWSTFVQAMGGHSLNVTKCAKYQNPLKDFGFTPRDQENKENMFTLEINDANPDSACEISKQIQEHPQDHQKKKKGDAVKLVAPGVSGADWLRTMRSILGNEMERGFCREIQVFDWLETHRRTIQLESVLKRSGIDVDVHPRVRDSVAALMMVDHISAFFYFAIGRDTPKFNIQREAQARLKTLGRDITPLLRYATDLSERAQALEGFRENIRIAPPYEFLSETVRAAVLGMQNREVTQQDRDEEMRRRESKERIIINELFRAQPGENGFIGLFHKMSRRIAMLLAADSAEANFTRFLPPTPCMPDAEYDADAFMSQTAGARESSAGASTSARESSGGQAEEVPPDAIHDAQP